MGQAQALADKILHAATADDRPRDDACSSPGFVMATRRQIARPIGGVDNETLRARMQSELDRLGLTGDVAERVVREVNFLACLLIEAAREGRLHD